jgi:anti-sigma B factor antagonist
MDGVGDGTPGGMTFDVAPTDGGTAVLTVRGELDISNIEPLEVAMAPVIESGPQRLVVDVRGLRFADSSAIALWVRWAASVGELELRDPSPLLRRVITSMGLGERFKVDA